MVFIMKRIRFDTPTDDILPALQAGGDKLFMCGADWREPWT